MHRPCPDRPAAARRSRSRAPASPVKSCRSGWPSGLRRCQSASVAPAVQIGYNLAKMAKVYSLLPRRPLCPRHPRRQKTSPSMSSGCQLDFIHGETESISMLAAVGSTVSSGGLVGAARQLLQAVGARLLSRHDGVPRRTPEHISIISEGLALAAHLAAADGAHLVSIVHVIQFTAQTLNQSSCQFLPNSVSAIVCPCSVCARMAHTKGRLF